MYFILAKIIVLLSFVQVKLDLFLAKCPLLLEPYDQSVAKG